MNCERSTPSAPYLDTIFKKQILLLIHYHIQSDSQSMLSAHQLLSLIMQLPIQNLIFEIFLSHLNYSDFFCNSGSIKFIYNRGQYPMEI